jgi:hypothetical protein
MLECEGENAIPSKKRKISNLMKNMSQNGHGMGKKRPGN